LETIKKIPGEGRGVYMTDTTHHPEKKRSKSEAEERVRKLWLNKIKIFWVNQYV